MNILFATAHPFLPQMIGGLQRSSNELAEHLIKKGHKVSFLCSLMPNGYLGIKGRILLKFTKNKAIADITQGYRVYRAWFPWEAVASICKKENIDVVVVLAREPVKMALAVQEYGTPVVMMLQDVEFQQHGGDFKDLGNVPCVANSSFTAQKYNQAFGVSPSVIHPMINPEKYKTETTRENVTFINTHPQKGLNIALQVAKNLPHIPFKFVEAWPLSAAEKQELMTEISALDNVTFSEPVSDIREIYKKAKIVIAPSRWEEAYGRVGSEPQFSGIPVIATNIGGLPEAVGKGGILIDLEEKADIWSEAIQKLWSDDMLYNDLSKKAIDNSVREAINIEYQINKWERILASAISK